MSLPASYEPHAIEERYYKIWEERGLFEIDSNSAIANGKCFSIMLPPPNVTGSLHIGHALNHTLIDIIVRYKRMLGYKTLWQPGVDHAGIATQNVVEKRLLAEHLTKEELGRDKFLEKVWEWKEHSGGTIVHQMRRLGHSPAWSRERFTMDEGLKQSVRKAFTELYNKGLIVRGNYMVNWCTHDGALSDIEVEHKESNGFLYHLRYPVKNSTNVIIVATTRPETYFGDTAVMVHPEDERYTHLIGKSVILPLINREIPIITDEHVDKEFGTGAVKVTPAHDTNDYEVGKRHNLPFLTIFNEKGILNDECGEFSGMERLEARSNIIEKLKNTGFFEKIEPHTNQVGHCYRCGNVVEPYISKQWFVKKESAQAAIDKVNNGDTQFIPSMWKNNYDAWMRELRDWCISRQLWWGHRIPVFYCDDCGHEWASQTEIEKECPQCQSKKIWQDPDVLDTWFSSALWPFSTLGWGNENDPKTTPNDLADFYPNSLLITGFDILFFWVARMLTMGVQFTGNVPFKDVYLHALVRDEHGHKMSKSKGNVIDPLEMVEQYSADALRFTLALAAAQGRDIRIGKSSAEQARNFTNKLFNASKFLLMNADSFADFNADSIKTPLGCYMAHRLSIATIELQNHLAHYRFNDAAMSIYRFLWDEFCDWGIELSKVSKESIPELGSIFKEAMKLSHPFMPFLTEYLYQTLSNTTLEESPSIMTMAYPKADFTDENAQRTFDIIKDAIVSIRRAKAAIGLANQRSESAFVNANLSLDNDVAAAFIRFLAKVETVTFVSTKVEGCAVDVAEFVETYVPMNTELKTALNEKLTKQKEKLSKELAKLNGMLSNERFIASAPVHVVEENKKAATDLAEKMAKIDEELHALA